jgi:succinate-acetate transporter protein
MINEAHEKVNPAPKRADPTALGIFAYGMSLMALSFYALGIYPASSMIVMLTPALAFGGLFLLIAAIWEYVNGNTFGATAFGCYSAFFLTFGLVHVGLKLGWFEDLAVAHLVGIFCLALAYITLVLWIGSFKMHLALNLTLFFLLLVFIFFFIPLMTRDASGHTAMGAWPGCLKTAGVFGMIDAVFTAWIGLAVVVNDRWERVGKKGPIPLFPIGQPK